MTTTLDPSRSRRVKSGLTIAMRIFALFIVSAFVLIEWGVTMCDPSLFLPLSCFSAVLVGPIVIDLSRRFPNRSKIALIRGAVIRASGSVLLIVIFSLLLVNLFFRYGQTRLPDVETFLWAVALSVTAASSVAATLALLLSWVSLQAAKWGSRAIMLGIVLLYRYLPPAWSIFLSGLVDEWGLTRVAFLWWLLFAATASAALVLLRRRKPLSQRYL
jgi:hypothetical protein